MKLGDLAGAEIAVNVNATQLDVTGLSASSAAIQPGFVFAALAGTRTHGAKFIPEAIARGAVAILVSPEDAPDDCRVPILAAPEPRKVFAKMAARFFPAQPETIVAVTGTAGKTSIASFVRQIWENEGRQAASIGTTGVTAPGREEYGNLTTPDPVELHRLLDEFAQGGITHLSMEASSHGLDQFRLDGVRLAAGGFTNLGRDHMDYHPTIAHYFNAKMRLFRELLPKDAPAVIFADDDWSAAVIEAANKAGMKVRSVGRKGEFLTLKRLEHERFRQIAEIQHGDDIYRVEFPLAGDFQLANALVAAGMAIATGSAATDVMNALAGLKGAKGRLELVGYNSSHSPVYVDYAHKPDAMRQVLLSLRPFVTGRLVIVFGCGGDRDAGKRPIMGKIAADLADIVFVTDDNPRSEDPAEIRRRIMEECPGAIEIGNRREAIEAAIAELGEGDCLVVAGKGHEEGQTVASRTLPFSDHQVVRETLSGVRNSGAMA
jgi:UDP-N-acetylmuramoyl-L-alanyl-D-glutamate--2,6-diaminopimelate ligase